MTELKTLTDAEMKGVLIGLEQAKILLRLSYMANGLVWGKSKKCKDLLDLFEASLSNKIKEISNTV